MNEQPKTSGQRTPSRTQWVILLLLAPTGPAVICYAFWGCNGLLWSSPGLGWVCLLAGLNALGFWVYAFVVCLRAARRSQPRNGERE